MSLSPCLKIQFVSSRFMIAIGGIMGFFLLTNTGLSQVSPSFEEISDSSFSTITEGYERLDKGRADLAIEWFQKEEDNQFATVWKKLAIWDASLVLDPLALSREEIQDHLEFTAQNTGTSHPLYGYALHLKAMSLYYQGSNHDHSLLIAEAWETFNQELGKPHFLQARILSQQAQFRFLQGDYELCTQSGMLALQIATECWKESQWRIAPFYESLALRYLFLGHSDSAASFAEKAYLLRKNSFPDKGINWIPSMFLQVEIAALKGSPLQMNLEIQKIDSILSQETTIPEYWKLKLNLFHLRKASSTRQIGEISQILSSVHSLRSSIHLTPEKTFDLNLTLAGAYIALSQFDSASISLQSTRDTLLQFVPPNHIFQVLIWLEEGHISWFNSKYKLGQTTLEKAIAVFESDFGQKHPKLAIAYQRLSWIYRRLGDGGKSEELITKAFQVAEPLFPPDHIEMSDLWITLGNTYKSLHKNEKSEEAFFKSP